MSRLQAFFARNNALKVAALALALLLWAAVRIDSPGERTLEDVPVQVTLNDRDWAVRAPLPGPVSIHVDGLNRDLLRLGTVRPSITIEIDDVSGSDTTVVIERDWVRLGARAVGTVVDVQPSAVRLSFEPVETRSVPMVVRALGAPPAGLALAAPLGTVPRTARVRGPATVLSEIDGVALEPVSLGGYRTSSTVTRAVDRSGIGDLEVTPDSVTVVITLEEEVERRVTGVPLIADPRAGPARLERDSVAVRVLGARSVLSRLDVGALLALARPAADGVDSTVWAVRIEGLPDLVRAEVEPARVRTLPPPETP
ncbi:MAG: hypothetical protein R3E98_02215 [Gemmatimonadota bacterium]